MFLLAVVLRDYSQIYITNLFLYLICYYYTSV